MENIINLIFNDNPVELPVYGTCMFPVFQPGESVSVKPVTYPLQKGKYYVFLHKGSLYVHRLYKIKHTAAQLYGDRSKNGESIPLSAFIGEPIYQNFPLTIFLVNSINALFLNDMVKHYSWFRKVRIHCIWVLLFIERGLREKKIRKA